MVTVPLEKADPVMGDVELVNKEQAYSIRTDWTAEEERKAKLK